MNIRGAIFDLDGTLTDSMTVWDRVPMDLVRHFGGVPQDDLPFQLKAMDCREAADYLIATYRLPCTPDEILAEINRLVDAEYRDNVPAKPGAEALLRELHTLGIPCCVATASEVTQAEWALKRLGLWQYMSFALSTSEYGSKSHPDIYLEAARRLGTPIESTLVFEDALHAARTASAAGFVTVGVYDPSAPEDQDALQALCHRYLARLDDPAFLCALRQGAL